MSTPTRLEQRFSDARARLNERRRRLVQAVLESSEESVFLSSRELARRYDADPATIVRTIQALGYRRFAEFSSDLREHFVARMTPYSLRPGRERAAKADSQIRGAIEQDLHNLQQLVDGLDENAVRGVAQQIHSARHVVVVGIDLAWTVAEYLAFKLRVVGVHAEAPVGSAGNLIYQVRLLTPRDLLIAISFGRCLKETVHAVLRARHRQVPTFGISDSHLTPIAQHCDGHLVAAVRNEFVAGSFAAPTALVSAILVALVALETKHTFPVPYDGEVPYKSDRWFAPESEPVPGGKVDTGGRSRHSPSRRGASVPDQLKR